MKKQKNKKMCWGQMSEIGLLPLYSNLNKKLLD